MFEFIGDVKQLIADIRSGDWLAALKDAGKILPQIADIIGKLFPVGAITPSDAADYTAAVSELESACGEWRAKPTVAASGVAINPLIVIAIVEEIAKLLKDNNAFTVA